ncbi:MAG: ImmA/IrrE family metallo-endopeptidase [Dehalococcoidia bacterium]|nr:ImmA/IrrE family metallo-endopeptidase [Dehalococcoidia bacterium]
MSKVIEPRKSMPTLAELWSGKCCPHETECACRTGSWCPEAKNRKPDGEGEYPTIHLTGCSFAYDHCCCRVLDEIEELADKYLKQAGVIEPPVPMDIISLFDTKRPVEIRPVPLRRFLGCTWLVDKEWVIHLNSNSSPEESLFTAFHEGFHVICGNSGLAFKRAGERYKKVSERLADYFSASILMPREFVYDFWPKVEDPIKMARIFGVPQPVMNDWLTRLRIVEA